MLAQVWKAPSFRLVGADICRYAPAAQRKALWEVEHGPVPEGMRVGWTCEVPYCGKVEHMELAENKNRHDANYRQYRSLFEGLKDGEYFEIPNVPNNRKALLKFRTGLTLSLAQTAKILLRSMPNGGMRVYKWGTWATYYQEGTEPTEGFPLILNTKRSRRGEQRPAVIWLGMWFNPHRKDQVNRAIRCSIQACPYPTRGATSSLCFQHGHFFEYPISMTDNKLDLKTVWHPKFLAPSNEYALYRERLITTASLEKSLVVTFDTQKARHPNLDNRHLNLGNAIKEMAPQSSPMKRGMHGGHGRGSSKTTLGRQNRGQSRRVKRDTPLRWNRETIEFLEREADKLLEPTSPTVKSPGEIMHDEQADSLGVAARRCYGKINYKMWARAVNAATKLSRRTAEILVPYNCPDCEGIHIGHPSKEALSALQETNPDIYEAITLDHEYAERDELLGSYGDDMERLHAIAEIEEPVFEELGL